VPLAEELVTLPGVGRTVRVAAPARSAGPDSLTAVAIPYFQWDNRDRGAMRVWLPAG
jgi:hypothetical protein